MNKAMKVKKSFKKNTVKLKKMQEKQLIFKNKIARVLNHVKRWKCKSFIIEIKSMSLNNLWKNQKNS